MSCRPVRWQLAFCEIKKKPQRAVHGLGILEGLGNVGVKKHNVGAAFVLVVMLPPALRRRNRIPVSCHRHWSACSASFGGRFLLRNFGLLRRPPFVRRRQNSPAALE